MLPIWSWRSRIKAVGLDPGVQSCDRSADARTRVWTDSRNGEILRRPDRDQSPMPNPKMTHGEIRSSRQKLGLRRSQFAELLEITEEEVARMEAQFSDPTHMVPGRRTVRLIEAYLVGYRPHDWPSANKTRT